MIKRTIYLGNPAYLSLGLGQLRIQAPPDADGVVPEVHTIPIEDIGLLMLDHPQLTLTHQLMQACMAANVAMVCCDAKHHPAGLWHPLASHVLQHERYQAQISATQPLKKQLWAQVIQNKLMGQAAVLAHFDLAPPEPLHRWAGLVKSGDTTNLEGRGAAYYWQHVLAPFAGTTRDPDGGWPNGAFNYAYAILRATVARALVAAGLLPTLGIHHHNRYNAFCLADDMMEPLRPVADGLVIAHLGTLPEEEHFGLSKAWKAKILTLPALDVRIEDERSPLMVASQRMAQSLYRCLEGESRKLALPSPLF